MTSQENRGGRERATPRPLATSIASHSDTSVRVRGLSLEKELIGRASYADMLMLGVLGRLPDENQRRVLDGCLVALMEAGLNPSSLATRLVSLTAPEQPQIAMAAGLLTVGDVYVGTVQSCAHLLAEIATSDNPAHAASTAVADLRRRRLRVPGLGHGRHRTDDPRALAVLTLADKCSNAKKHCEALKILRQAATEQLGRSLVINVTGAVAGALLDLGFPVEATRPIALAARAGGLVAHIVEERLHPVAKDLWTEALARVPYHDPEASAPAQGGRQEVEPWA